MKLLHKLRLGPKGTWALVSIGLVIVLLAGVALAGWSGTRWWANSSRVEAVDAARDIVTKLYTVTPSTIDEDLMAVEEAATGTFAEQWKSGEDTVRESVLSAGASRKPEIKSLGYLDGNSSSAEVLVAVDTVTEFGTPLEETDLEEEEIEQLDTTGDGYRDPEDNRWRLQANLAVVDGDWKMSNLEVTQ